MVPVWGWGALLCMVLKAHHSPSQSLHCCSARSRGAGVIAQAFQHSAQLQPGSRWPALWLTVITPERRGEMKRSWELKTGEMGWISPVLLLICQHKGRFTQWENTFTFSVIECRSLFNTVLWWLYDNPWMIKVFECQSVAVTVISVCYLNILSCCCWFQSLPQR